MPRLAQHFVETFSREFRWPVRGSAARPSRLRDYGWPGNVRELRNLVERAVLLSVGEVLRPPDFESWVAAAAPAPCGPRFSCHPTAST